MAQSIIRTKPIDSLVIHHTVVPGQNFTKEAAQKALNANQYAYDGNPPYHYIIGNTWDYQGRPYNTIGYHAGSWHWNEISIGIALMGNFNNDTPTPHQEKRLAEVIKELMRVYNIPRSRVFLHKQVRPEPTACPGSKITQEYISKLLNTPMPNTCEQDLAIANEEIRKLNTEIGTVTAQRDLAQRELQLEKVAHAETVKRADSNYANWQAEIDRRKRAEKKLYEIEGILES